MAKRLELRQNVANAEIVEMARLAMGGGKIGRTRKRFGVELGIEVAIAVSAPSSTSGMWR